jgi:hypothetical protein
MNFQVLAPLRPEEYAALKADIARRGVLVPVEVAVMPALPEGPPRPVGMEKEGR